jgi:hypothetical protein
LIHIDDSLVLIGITAELKKFKAGIKKRFGYMDLGKLLKHLGVWYEEKCDENGECYLEVMMPQASTSRCHHQTLRKTHWRSSEGV